MTLFLLLAPALAGDLSLDIDQGDEQLTIELEGLAPCAPFTTHLRSEQHGSWRVRGLAALDDNEDVVLSLDIEAERGRGRRVRQVHSSPTVVFRADEEAEIQIGRGDEVDLAVRARLTGLAPGGECLQEVRRRR